MLVAAFMGSSFIGSRGSEVARVRTHHGRAEGDAAVMATAEPFGSAVPDFHTARLYPCTRLSGTGWIVICIPPPECCAGPDRGWKDELNLFPQEGVSAETLSSHWYLWALSDPVDHRDVRTGGA